MQVRTLYLQGALGKKLGRVHKVYVNSIAEAMKYLAVNFGNTFYDNIKKGYYRIKKVTNKDTIFMGEDGLTMYLGEGDLYVTPVTKGASSARQKQVGMIIAGVALAAVTFGAGAALAASAGTISSFGAAFTTAAGASAAVAATGTVGTVAFSMAAAFALQGIAGLLTPTQKVKSSEGQDDNAGTTAGIMNNAREGSTIPVIYGKVKVGSVVISSGVYAEQLATDTQYTVVMNYLNEYVNKVTQLVAVFETAVNTTNGSTTYVESRNGGYSYYPGLYPHIKTSLQTMLDRFTVLLDRAKNLQEQAVNTFSLTDYTNLVDSTLAYCNQIEPTILGLYNTVGEVCDFYVVDDVYKMSKQSASYQGKIKATSLIISEPTMRSYSSVTKSYSMYYASTRTESTLRKMDTMTPLDCCYFMVCVIKYVLQTLKDRENW